MLDIKIIRNNPDMVKAAMKKRNKDMDAAVDEIMEIDRQRREISSKSDGMKAQQNAASKKIPAMKKAGEDTTELMAEMKKLSELVKECDQQVAELEERQKQSLTIEYRHISEDNYKI